MNLLVGEDGKLRPLWRVVIFFALGTWVIFPALHYLTDLATAPLHLASGLTGPAVALSELVNFLTALLCTAIFALYERRRIDSYGLPLKRAFGKHSWEGVAAGVFFAGGVALGMFLLGGMQVHGLATGGGALGQSALVWLVAMILAGLAEEFFYRGYILQTLWKSIGFWPASIVIALVFAADHYFYKDGENIWDVITLVWFSLLLCYSVLRSGTLWFAVGLHFSFDYMQIFVIGTPNGSRLPVGRLFDATFDGPAWLTGGALGTEASFLIYPLLALISLYVWWRFRGMPPADSSPS